jgi:hydroxyacylglutathione hydrolase
MAIEIYTRTLGMVATNAYLVGDTETRQAILIDPVDEPEILHQMALDANFKIELILATHAHFDHVLASARLVELTGAPFWIHHEAAPLLDRLPQTGVMFTGKPYPEAATPDRLLNDGDMVELGAMRLASLYTPGHAPGHLSFYMASEQTVFTGDSLFAGTVGRTDLDGGDMSVLMHSIKTQLLTLGDDVRVLAGHGGESTIGRERRTNPYLLQYID